MTLGGDVTERSLADARIVHSSGGKEDGTTYLYLKVPFSPSPSITDA